MVTKFDVGDEVVIKGVVDSIAMLPGGIFYSIKSESKEIIVAEESPLLKAESTTNDFPCKIGDKFYFPDTLYKDVIEDVCTGFQQLSDGLYIHGKKGGLFYTGNVYFTKEEAEKALKEREKK